MGHDGECCGGNCHEEECSMSEKLLIMSDDAWADLFIDKMKKHYEKHKGEHMDKLAHLTVNASIELWSKKMKGEDVKDVLEKFSSDLDEAMKK